ncbi:hypothetical protein GCM10010082_31480 [Kushneria pakistanensis]|uniref:Uncharacterized protein n=1 Tax=Kushneria pakistanensis TaxID=1508770 RepID=A0ABQ3FR19_9GAMM|nr:hypothetical protein [Kushneria pakistanensis]GHC34516.1 hypothetical protein GCM10010082_31480 [Kushneria pakistanensis]
MSNAITPISQLTPATTTQTCLIRGTRQLCGMLKETRAIASGLEAITERALDSGEELSGQDLGDLCVALGLLKNRIDDHHQEIEGLVGHLTQGAQS